MYVHTHTHTHTHTRILIQRTVHMGNLNCTTHQVWNVNLSNLTVLIFWCESKKFSTATWLVDTTQYSNPSVYEMHKLIPTFEIVSQFSLLWCPSHLQNTWFSQCLLLAIVQPHFSSNVQNVMASVSSSS